MWTVVDYHNLHLYDNFLMITNYLIVISSLHAKNLEIFFKLDINPALLTIY